MYHKDLTGKKFGRLEVVKITDERRARSIVWECKCDCGKIACIASNLLQSSHVQSCGCARKAELVGQRFGELTVVALSENKKFGKQHWHCKCDCGEDTELATSLLTGRIVRSCGCRRRIKGREKANYRGIRNLSGRHWGIIQRCAEQRGISFNLDIQNAWNLFEKQNGICALSGLPIFLRRKKGDGTTASLDRIDSSKGYTLDNVQWVHKDVNFMKSDMDEERFIEICKAISQWKKTKI